MRLLFTLLVLSAGILFYTLVAWLVFGLEHTPTWFYVLATWCLAWGTRGVWEKHAPEFCRSFHPMQEVH